MAKETANNGWICLHRAMRDWQWYDDAIIKSVFIDLLFSACTEPTWFKGRKLGRGQSAISVDTLAQNTGLSKPTVIKALRQLEESGEIVRTKWKFYVITTIRNYSKYQDFGQKVSKNNLPTSLPTSLPNKQYNNNNNIVEVEYNAHARTREAVVNDFFAGGISVESFCLNNHVTVDQCRGIAEAVVTEWELTGELTAHATLSDERKHLIAQMRIKAEALRAKGQLLSEPFEVRRKRFIAECMELIAKGFAKAEVADFYAYYSQKEQGGERMLFETYKGWDTQTRFLLNKRKTS